MIERGIHGDAVITGELGSRRRPRHERPRPDVLGLHRPPRGRLAPRDQRRARARSTRSAPGRRLVERLLDLSDDLAAGPTRTPAGTLFIGKFAAGDYYNRVPISAHLMGTRRHHADSNLGVVRAQLEGDRRGGRGRDRRDHRARDPRLHRGVPDLDPDDRDRPGRPPRPRRPDREGHARSSRAAPSATPPTSTTRRRSRARTTASPTRAPTRITSSCTCPSWRRSRAPTRWRRPTTSTTADIDPPPLAESRHDDHRPLRRRRLGATSAGRTRRVPSLDELRELSRGLMVDIHRRWSRSRTTRSCSSKAKGIRVRDASGRWYIDGLSGVFISSYGHGNERLAGAAAEQARQPRVRDAALLGQPPDAPARRPAARGVAGRLRRREVHRERLRRHRVRDEDGPPVAPPRGPRPALQGLRHYRSYHGSTGHSLAASGGVALALPYEPFAAGFIHVHPPFALAAPDRRCSEEAGRSGRCRSS